MSAQTQVAWQLQRICPVSRETLDRLEHLVSSVQKWSRAINLVSDPRPEVIWERHVLDSAQLFPLRSTEGFTWCDLGSGGGFPGLVIGVLAREHAPSISMTLVESDRRKATFLTAMARELDLNVLVATSRAENLARQDAETVSARALAPLPRLLALVNRHLAESGIALLPKGQTFDEEIAAAQQSWAFTVDAIPSIVSPQSRILRVADLRRLNAS
jgi:16S rRNA (guanine527-N7)-methyltransferase